MVACFSSSAVSIGIRNLVQATPLSSEMRAKLTARFLRDVFPQEMNVQCGRELLDRDGEGP